MEEDYSVREGNMGILDTWGQASSSSRGALEGQGDLESPHPALLRKHVTALSHMPWLGILSHSTSPFPCRSPPSPPPVLRRP